MKYYFETPNGDTNENVSFEQIKKAISNLKEMDKEHGAFWVGDKEGIATLEIHKNLKLFVHIEEDDIEVQIQLESEKEVENIFNLFLLNKLETILNIINEKTKNL